MARRKKPDYFLLNKKLIQSIGFDLNGFYLIDQDTMQPVIIKDKYLKYSENKVTLIHKNEILFNPLYDRKLMLEVFTLFLAKEEIFSGIYTQMYYNESDAEGRTSLVIKTSEGDFKSDYYYNDTLKFIDIILNQTTEAFDLHQYDDPNIRKKRR